MNPNTLVLLATVSGYGDVSPDGYPSWSERAMHLYTNMVRVDPEAFEDDYINGGCDLSVFSEDERTPKTPLYFNAALNKVARDHSEDMRDSGNFSHSSSDGTSFADRVWAVYESEVAIGENIAYGYSGPWSTVANGWMCSSSGHRESIMSADYTELGCGMAESYATQDFGGAAISPPGPVAMGIHEPEAPSGEVAFVADWTDEEAPAQLRVLVDGKPLDLSLMYGTERSGVYGIDEVLTADYGDGCLPYYFRYVTASGLEGTFPEEGSYLLGDCDSETMWIDAQDSVSGTLGGVLPGLEGTEDASSWEPSKSGRGCSVASGAAGLALLPGLLAIAFRRHRREGSSDCTGYKASLEPNVGR